jgi:HSP20 family protein
MATALMHPTAWIDRFFEDLDRGWYRGRTDFVPTVDVIEEKDAYVLRAEMPGIPKDSKYHYVESRYGEFSRTFELPRDVRTDAIRAEYKDGVLNLRIPKTEEAKPKAIEIK